MLRGVSFEGMESRRSFAEGKDLESKKGGLKKQNNVESTAVLHSAGNVLGTRSCLRCLRQGRTKQSCQYYLTSWKMYLSCY